MNVFVAPMQGLTDAAWRSIHAGVYGAADAYFSPFLRVENGMVRAKELRDITSPLNKNIRLIPQAIFRSVDELKIIAEAVSGAGYHSLDLNLGCPFPPQLNRGRGAAIVARPEVMELVAQCDFGLDLSVKMRPGVTSYDEWKTIMPILNSMKLNHVTIHPRLAIHGYKGPVNMECFAEMTDSIRHKIVYNGGIYSPLQIDTYNNIYGVMVGRGLIARPSMIEEWRSEEVWGIQRRISHLRLVLERLLQQYSETMCGDLQIIRHVQAFVEYVDPDFPPRIMKQLRKSQSIRAFEKALHEFK
ncbi:MAG: tRNA-dihydrouridine synthase family protein [Muribaculaceae bacterium]|nr:tRNA-dihydrouridine synthase family protein [Muribaculaceae bacterium]